MSPKQKFILTNGLGWGLCTFLVTSAWRVWIDHLVFTWMDAVVLQPIWLIAGLAWGHSMWRYFERKKAAR
jgi:hypothetical protein